MNKSIIGKVFMIIGLVMFVISFFDGTVFTETRFGYVKLTMTVPFILILLGYIFTLDYKIGLLIKKGSD